MSTDPTHMSDERPMLPSLRRGWTRKCPHCGNGALFNGYLSVCDTCETCGEEFHHHRADDMPAWATILIVGHLLASAVLTVEQGFQPPYWVHVALWPTLGVALCLLLLPRIKGAVVAMQWANRMHGFDLAREPAQSLD